MRHEQGVYYNTHDHNFLFSRQMSVLDLPLEESHGKHHNSPVYPTLHAAASCKAESHPGGMQVKHQFGESPVKKAYVEFGEF